MVKSVRKGGSDAICFSPLLILFMVKLKHGANKQGMSFSPLLILFMVKFQP